MTDTAQLLRVANTALDLDGSAHTLTSQATICAAPGIAHELVGLVSGSVGPMRRPAVDIY